MISPFTRAAGLLAALGPVLLTGCGTLFSGTSQNVTVTSDPPGVTVFDSGSRESFTTPATQAMSKARSHRLQASKEGYQPQTIALRREARVEWWVLDAFSLGIGNLIDAATGGLFAIKPDRVHIVLEPDELDMVP